MFRRKLLIIGLAIGTVGGFAAGFRSMRHCSYNRAADHHGGYGQHSAYAEGFAAGARACAEAARDK